MDIGAPNAETGFRRVSLFAPFERIGRRTNRNTRVGGDEERRSPFRPGIREWVHSLVPADLFLQSFHPILPALSMNWFVIAYRGNVENRRGPELAPIPAIRRMSCFTHEPLLKGAPVIRKGEKMEGRFFPMLKSREQG